MINASFATPCESQHAQRMGATDLEVILILALHQYHQHPLLQANKSGVDYNPDIVTRTADQTGKLPHTYIHTRVRAGACLILARSRCNHILQNSGDLALHVGLACWPCMLALHVTTILLVASLSGIHNPSDRRCNTMARSHRHAATPSRRHAVTGSSDGARDLH
jgi:hypothetical protein